MVRFAVFLALIGLALVTFIVAQSGFHLVLQALGQAGFGILWTSLFHLISLFASVLGWWILMPGQARPSLSFMYYVMWLRASVNNLMPVARIGGEFIAIRVMLKNGIRESVAVSTTIVELTLSVIAVFLFTLCGVVTFLFYLKGSSLAFTLTGGLLVALVTIFILLGIQRIGFFGLLQKIFQKLFRSEWLKIMRRAERLDRAVLLLYRRTDKIILCGLLQFFAWSLGTFEIWFGLYFLNHPIGLKESFIIEALAQATSSAAFAVPGALGIQEAGFLLFGQILGLPAEIAVALALLRRCRDLILFIPGLICWQIQEGRWLVRPKAA